MDINRTFSFLLITFAVCVSLTESFPRVLSRVPDYLSKPVDSSEEDSESYSDETQQNKQVLRKDQVPVSTDSSEQLGIVEQNGDNQFTFASSEQFAVEQTNGTDQQDLLFTGDHHTAVFEEVKPSLQKTVTDEAKTFKSGQSESNKDSALRASGKVTNRSNSSAISTKDSLSKNNKSDSQSLDTEKTIETFTGNNESSTGKSDNKTSFSTKPKLINSQSTTLTSKGTMETGHSSETSDETISENINSANQNVAETHVIVNTSPNLTTKHPTNLTSVRPNNAATERPTSLTTGHSTDLPTEGPINLTTKHPTDHPIEDDQDGHSTKNPRLNLTSGISDSSDKCDSTSFVKPTSESKPADPVRIGTSFIERSAESDKINASIGITVSSVPENNGSKGNDTFINNRSIFETKTGDTLLPGSEPIVAETLDTVFSPPIVSESPQNVYPESQDDASESTLTTACMSSTDQSLPELSVQNEHAFDTQHFIAPPFLSKHILKDADNILHESHTSNDSHDLTNHTDGGLPHSAVNVGHTSRDHHDLPHTNASTENPHHVIGRDEPLLPHSTHMHTSLHTNLTDSQHHVIAGDEPQLPHSHHINTSHHVKLTGSPRHTIGGDEPHLPHSHNMKTPHHSHTDSVHHIIGGDEPKLPHSHHMDTTAHTDVTKKLTENTHHAVGSNEPKLSHSSHEDTSSHVMKQSNMEEAFTSSTPTESTVILEEPVKETNPSEESEAKHELKESSVEDSLKQVHTDNTSVEDNKDQISSDDESILVSDEQYPSEIDQFPTRNHNYQGSEQQKELNSDGPFLNKPTIFQEHEADKSKNQIKEIKISDDSSVNNPGSSVFTSSVVSSSTVANGTAQHQDTTFLSGDVLSKKQANGDIQYFIEHVIYPKQIASNIRSPSVKQISPEPSGIRNKPLFVENKEFESTESPASFTNFTTENPNDMQLKQEHRFTIPEILSTIPEDNNDRFDDNSKSINLDAHKHANKTFYSSSTITNTSISGVITDGSDNNETIVQESIASDSSNRNVHQYRHAGKYHYTTPTPTTLIKTPPTSTISSTSLGTESTSSEETTSSMPPSEVSTMSSSISSTSTTVASTSPSTSSQATTMSVTSTSTGTTSPGTESTSAISSQATTLSTSIGTSSLSTTNTSPDTESTSKVTSSEATTPSEASTSTVTSSEATTSSDTTNTDEETVSPLTSSKATSTITPSTTSSSAPSTTDMETTQSSSSSQPTSTITPSSTSSSSPGTTTSPEAESTSQSTTVSPSHSTISSTSSGTTSTAPEYTTPPYRHLTTVNTPDEHFKSTENSNKDTTSSLTIVDDQLTTIFPPSDSSQIKFEHPPKPYIGVKHGRPGIKGGDRKRMFYYHSKPWYYISEGRRLQNPF